MALRDEQADILGGPILQRPESTIFASFAQYHFAFKSVVLLVVGLLVWIVCVRGLEHLKKHRELRYRKAMRRKHGIPDSDCRPFAVAYAAVKRAHVEREAQDRKKTTNYVSDHSSPAVGQRTDARKDARGLRRRVPETTVQLLDYQLPAEHASAYDSKRREPDSLNFADRYNPNSRHRVAVPKPSPLEWPPVRRASRKALVIHLDDSEESRKRSFEDESDVEHETIKKSRIDGDELIDGEDPADWYAQYSDEPLGRASEESPEQQYENNFIHTNNQEQSSDHPDEEREVVDEAMEDIDEGEATKLKAVARGKKRDRAEAGSTFGGDEDEDIRNGRASHHRKRRTILRRTIEVPTRGQKRDREAESPESGGEGGGSETSQRRTHRGAKKKRGKKVFEDANEILAEDPRVSKDPLCGGRKVGVEWEDDGIQYRVGNKGERLRLTLVKKAKNKYHMPQDSQHPDRSAALEIYVETWMTEKQYKQAEGRQELAWQETPRESNGSRTPDVFDSPTKNGKNLLWDSVRGSPARPPFRQFMTAGALTRINPFEQWQLQPTIGRRVASSSTIVSPILPGVADSPTRPGFRGFSKWEKQDREAEAMVRIRAKVEEQKKVRPPPQKIAEIIASELATKPISVPTITLTPAPTVAEGGSENSTRQSKANAPTLSSMEPTAIDSVKGNTAPGPTLLSTSTPSATSSTLFPSAPTTTTTSASLSPFSFAKPPQLPSSTIPNFFEKGTGAGASSSSTPSPSALGATTQPQSSSSGSASKPALFSFAKPDTSSAAVPPTVKSQTSIFGGTLGSSPSSATFGSTPVAAKAESSHPPPALTSATSESLKATAPLFSFSGTSPSTTTLPASSTPSVPKFSFGQPSVAPVHAPGSSLAPGTSSQAKPTFKFGQASPSAVDGASASTVRAADESKKSALPALAFGATTSLNELAKPPSSGVVSTFGSSSITLPLPPATNLFGKLAAGDSEASTSTPPKHTLAPVSTATFDNNAFSSAPDSGNTPALSFGISPGAKSAEGSKPASLFGGAAGGSNPVSMFGGNSTENKPTFTFGASAQGLKPSSIFSGNTENMKPPAVFSGSTEGSKLTFAFGGSAATSKPASAFGGSVEEPKSTFAFSATTDKSTSGPATESEKPTSLSTTSDSAKLFNTVDAFKPISSPGSTIFGSSSASPFTFGKDDAAINPSTSNTQTKPSFPFGTPSSATDLIFGQPFAFATSGESSQAILGKPSNTTPGAFTFGTGGSGPSGTFTFGKPAAQNQKQEQ